MKSIMIFMIFMVVLTGCYNGKPTIDKKFPSFATQDLRNNDINNSVFGEKKITVISILMIDNTQCRELIPKLRALNDKGEDIQIIVLITDAKKIEIFKRDILFDCPKDFIYLTANEDFKELLMEITQVPTTIFVDKFGNIVGQPVVGDNIMLIRREINNLLNMESPDFNNLIKIQSEIFY